MSSLIWFPPTHHVAEVEGAVVNKLNQVKVKEEEFQISCILLVGRDLGRSCCGASWPGFLDYTAHCSIRYPKKLTGFHFDAQPGVFLVGQPFLNSQTIGAVLKLIPEPREETEG